MKKTILWLVTLFYTLIIGSFLPLSLSAQNQNPEAYRKALSYADSMYKIRDFKSALAAYQYSLRLNPDDTKVKIRISELESVVNQQNVQKKQVDLYLYQAEKLIREGKFSDAQAELLKARNLLPADKDVTRLSETLNQLIAEKIKKDNAYSDTLDKADKYLNNNYFNKAISSFQQARIIKNEPEITERIAKTKANQQQNKTQSLQHISEADKFVSQNKLELALAEYRLAFELFPEDKQLSDKLQQIQSSVSYLSELNTLYQTAVKDADEAFVRKDFPKAIKKYNEALDFRPDEEYPKSRIRSIKNDLASVSEKEQQYKQLISEGESFMISKLYSDALTSFENAHDLKPGEKLPVNKISELKNILAKIQSGDDQYKNFISQANALYVSSQYIESKSYYQKALNLKSESEEAHQGIARIDSTLNSKAIAENNFKKIVQRADEHLKSSRFDEAINSYTEALAIKPGDIYVIKKEEEARRILAERRDRSEMYKLAITNGDLYFQQKNLVEAYDQYTSASKLKPEEDYPKQKLSEIKEIQKQNKHLQEQYNGFIKLADAYLKEKNYNLAKTEYSKARGIIPAITYPISQIRIIDSLMIVEADISNQYNQTIVLADKAFDAGNLIQATNLYQKALKIKPGESLPAGRISLINKLITDQNQAVEDAFRLAMSNGEKLQLEGMYEKSLTEYETASSVKPGNPEALRKIDEINRLMKNKAMNIINYQQFVKSADSLFDAKLWQPSKIAYQSANQINSAEKHPIARISRINSIIDSINKTETSYNQTIANGDLAFSSDRLTDALQLFQQAVIIKPLESYPSQKIKEIGLIMKSRADKVQAMEECKKKAMATYEVGKLEEALLNFQQCQKLESGDSYINNMIVEISGKINQRDLNNALFSKRQKSADSLFNDRLYEDALSVYRSATSLKPADKHCIGRIEEVEKILDKRETDAISFAKNLKSADSCFEVRLYDNSLKYYLETRKYKAKESYVEDRIAQINALLTKPKEVEGITYDKAILAARQYEAKDQIDKAYEHYLIALHLEPHQEIPKERLREIISQVTTKNMLVVSETPETIKMGASKTHSVPSLNSKKNNYIVIKLSESVTQNGKLVVNFGRGNSVLGGIVLRILQNQEFSYYIANLSSQSGWTESNNQWLRFSAENSDINILGVYLTTD
ncbi:MAG: hypothetical protein Q7J34_11390 [Bacteroidales bacterium]|nr:hypothetical protein [Bacteroidales bacterium]